MLPMAKAPGGLSVMWVRTPNATGLLSESTISSAAIARFWIAAVSFSAPGGSRWDMLKHRLASKWDDETSGTMQGGTPLLISLIS